jgi:hypothetical protein
MLRDMSILMRPGPLALPKQSDNLTNSFKKAHTLYGWSSFVREQSFRAEEF